MNVGGAGSMNDHLLLAQAGPAGPPPVLPMFPGGPNPPAHVPRPPQQIIDFLPLKVDPNALLKPPYLSQHAQSCLIAPFPPSKEVIDLFEKCNHFSADSKMLHPDHPECSCEVYHSKFPDFVLIAGKTPMSGFSFHATDLGVYFLGIIILLFGAILWSPIGYAISAYKIRKKMNALERHHVFMIWYEKVWTRNISLLMIVSGILMTAAGVSGDVNLVLPGGYEISTALPGVVICVLAIFLWLRSSHGASRDTESG
jgi:hypothetical protein